MVSLSELPRVPRVPRFPAKTGNGERPSRQTIGNQCTAEVRAKMHVACTHTSNFSAPWHCFGGFVVSPSAAAIGFRLPEKTSARPCLKIRVIMITPCSQRAHTLLLRSDLKGDASEKEAAWPLRDTCWSRCVCCCLFVLVSCLAFLSSGRYS